MKIVAFASFKGGSGKTTALMAACSSLVAQGVRVALFEADRNAPLSLWRERALAQQTWDESCRIYPPDELASFEGSFEAAEKEGYDVALADTRGGASDLNDAILVNADLVVVPRPVEGTCAPPAASRPRPSPSRASISTPTTSRR